MITVIDDYLTAPFNGKFPTDKVKRDVEFWLGDNRYQIRVEQRGTEDASYAGLYCWSAYYGEFKLITTRKIVADYGLRAPGQLYDDNMYDEIIEELSGVAIRFETNPNSVTVAAPNSTESGE